MTTNRGKLLKVLSVSNEDFQGVSCVSSSTCYATEARANGGVGIPAVTTLHDGTPGTFQKEPVFAFAIACAGTTCWTAEGNQALRGPRS